MIPALLVLSCGACLMLLTGAAVWLVFFRAERWQDDYRARLAGGPMHQHDGRPCYGAHCAPARYTADPWKEVA